MYTGYHNSDPLMFAMEKVEHPWFRADFKESQVGQGGAHVCVSNGFCMNIRKSLHESTNNISNFILQTISIPVIGKRLFHRQSEGTGEQFTFAEVRIGNVDASASVTSVSERYLT